MSSIESAPYQPRRTPRSEFAGVRGLRYHLHVWGEDSMASAERPPLVLLHGWMDVGASFQFVVDALAEPRLVVAPDWRGFGLSDASGADSYWFPDYLADLDALLDARWPGQAIDLVGHSMGGNIAMIYGGVRSARVRRLVNLEGFGLPERRPQQAPRRYAQWLDALREPPQLRSYASLEDVATRLRKTNPLLTVQRARWLAAHWSRERADGQFEILGDPAHKLANPVLYRKDEVLECWKQIQAPLLWVQGDRTDTERWWGQRYTLAEFHERLAVVPQVEKHVLADAGHMLHHDQPEALARRLETFLAG